MGAEQQPDTDQWYLVRGGKQYGPYPFSGLVAAAAKNIIQQSDFVWRPGWDDWRRAGTVEELFSPPLITPNPPKTDLRYVSSEPDWERVGAIEQQPAPTRSRSATKRGNYLLRHWRGDFSLGWSYWINGILAALFILAASLAFAQLVEGIRSSAAIAAMLAAFGLLAVCVCAWQLVGIWRSATLHKSRGGKTFWAVAAKVMVVFGIARTLVEISSSFVPVISEHVQIALGDQRMGEHRFRVLRNGTELEFSGRVRIGTAKEFARMLDAAAQVRVVHLNSNGGRIEEAKLIGDEIRKRKLVTYVAERCASACTYMFLAGRERWIGEGGKLGFHEPSFPGLTRDDLAPLIQKERIHLVSMGLPNDFVAKALSTPNSSMWWPSHKELLAARIISGVADNTKFAASGRFASTATTEHLAQFLTKMPIYATLERVEPDAFQEMVQQFAEGYKEGASEIEIISKARPTLLRILRRYIPKASPAALLETVDITVGYMDGLKGTDPESCVALADPSKGAQLKVNLFRQFPALAERELALNKTILEAGAQGAVSIPTEQDVEPTLTKVFAQLAKRPGIQVDLLDKKTLAASDHRPYCELNLEFFREIRRLPAKDGIEVLRYLFAQIDQ